MRVLALILASTWFFPVSCTLGLFGGTHAIAKLDQRHAASGDELHPTFSVAAEPGDGGKPFRVLTRDELAKAPKGMSYRLSKRWDQVDLGQSRFYYKVLADEQGVQLVELQESYKGGDKDFWSRYRASATGVVPVSTRMMIPSYMAQAFVFAFVLALALYLAGKHLIRRYPPASKAPAG